MPYELKTKSNELTESPIDSQLDNEWKIKLYHDFTKGEINSALRTYEEYSQTFDEIEFFERIFKPTLNQIEKDFINEKISTASQHVAVNIATILTRKIVEKEPTNIKYSNNF